MSQTEVDTNDIADEDKPSTPPSMNEEQAATAVFGMLQGVKRAIGREKAIGMVLGAVIGELVLTGGTKEQLDALCTEAWYAFQKAVDGG